MRVEKSAAPARQGERDFPVFLILVVSTLLTTAAVLGLATFYLAWSPTPSELSAPAEPAEEPPVEE